MKDRKRLIIVLTAIVLVTAVIYFGIHAGRNRRNIIRVSGNIEVTDAELSFRLPGRVEARLVDEGEIVKAGQVIARLDSTELVQEVALRKAEVQAARAAMSELLAGSRPVEIAQAQAAAQQAQARLDEMLAGSRSQEVATARAAVARAKAGRPRRR